MVPATMQSNRKTEPACGIVVSDLHLFAQRSRAMDCIKAIRPRLVTADILVLNGDIFDFRWSALPNVHATATAAIAWLRHLLESFPQCRIHYVIGNHDCLRLFRERLAALESDHARLQCHEHGVRLGNALFLHGDCTHRKMDPARLRRYRHCWDNDRQHGRLRTKAYLAVDCLGITRLTHAGWFPRSRTVKRIAHYLDHACPDWRQDLRDCYFGHTHLPFSDHEHEGVNFHNTGSAIRGMGFNPKNFIPSTLKAEPLGRHL
jgi:UDP-2,3-diacylglucosamine pyrophosphatase LpxH